MGDAIEEGWIEGHPVLEARGLFRTATSYHRVCAPDI